MPRYFTTEAIGSSLLGSVGSIALKPRLFFTSLDQTSSYRNSIIFLLLLLFVPALIDGYQIDAEHLLIMFPVMEGVGLLLAWIWTEYIYWSIKIFTDHELSHTSAFQLAAYSSTPLILDITPFLLLPSFIWQLYLIRQGLIRYAGVESSSVTMIIMVPIVMLIAMCIAAIMMLALMGLDLVTPYLQ